uniref:ZP domain-containing protein n=1 Tax=Strongyloides papillosus TaxID=174720 RepID=A0A0N5BQZ4_STREA
MSKTYGFPSESPVNYVDIFFNFFCLCPRDELSVTVITAEFVHDPIKVSCDSHPKINTPPIAKNIFKKGINITLEHPNCHANYTKTVDVFKNCSQSVSQYYGFGYSYYYYTYRCDEFKIFGPKL